MNSGTQFPYTAIAIPSTKPQHEQNCGNCNAFRPNVAANPKSGEERQGWCRAVPPVVILIPGGSIPATFGAWPTTGSKQWCRQWISEES